MQPDDIFIKTQNPEDVNSFIFFPNRIRNSFAESIIQEVSALTNGRVVLGAGTLYGAIQALVKKQWIAIYSEDTDSRKKRNILSPRQEKRLSVQKKPVWRSFYETRR